MTAEAGALAVREAGAASVGHEAVDRLARWLLVAVALDLLLTRIVVRLAIFIPKGDPWATMSAALGRVGGATDVLVPIVGILLLGALLLRAGRLGSGLEQMMLAALTVIAVGGLALVRLPPTPSVVVALDLLVAFVAAGAAIRLGRDRSAPLIARLGIVAVALATMLAAAGRALDASGALGTPGAPGAADTGWVSGLAIGALGQIVFVAGAALVGLGGIVTGRWSGPATRRYIGIGALVATVVLLAGTSAPLPLGAIAIWSVGLSGSIPLPILALALGLAVAGLPVLHRHSPALTVGAAVVLFAGYGLAASGLLLAGLLGLVVAASGDRDAQAVLDADGR